MADRKHVYSPLRSADTVDVMAGLFDRSRDRLTAEDLAAIEALRVPAIATLRALGNVAEGILCLVAHDASQPAGSGSLQDSAAVADLMQLVAGVADHVTGMLELGNSVELERMGREQK